ncbi:urease accessory protein UreH domain-containing protein [Bacillus sp. V33-4]|uniref:urease accessory protein UreH domain-containing protein n=1 Tax=Bacillus sp. V33-4 TaxID=2054169 RepID=UPI000C75BC20|nr:sulfite exporter TauE/SafE family protein [Bacillus sp. V33-4]PLR83999.1 cytochrome C biosynthesis protein [Bacillus sp. V33-4]
MYEFFSQMYNILSQPFLNMYRSTEGMPMLAAFILGIIGALAPCQFTGNLGAITIYGNRSVQTKLAWREILYFILGKIVVFSGLGLLVWLLGSEVKSILTVYFPWIRKMVGPLLIIIGLFMIGALKFYKSFTLGKIPERFMKKGNLGAFLMGVSFTLGFCPTMFVLFFITLMPMAISVSYGLFLPGIFAIGTSLPLILFIFLIWYFKLNGKLMKKKGSKLGLLVQKIAGGIMLILGIFDTLTYWGG